jgi:hypothetical protein
VYCGSGSLVSGLPLDLVTRDSDCEDLGDADAIAKVCSSVDVGTQR